MNLNKKTIILSILGFIVVVGLTVVILSLSLRQTSPPPAQVLPPQSAKTVAKLFQEQVDAGTLLAGGQLTSTASPSKTQLYIRDMDINTYLEVEASDSVLVTSPQPLTKDSLGRISDAVKKFFADQNMDASTDTAGPAILVSGASATINCQLETLSAPSQPTTQMKFICADASHYKDTVKTVNQLVSLWTDHQTTQYDLITQSTTTAKAATVTILQAMPRDMSTAHILVFAKGTGDWKYIGDASQGTSVVPSDKYIITKDIKDAFSNAEYGQLLKQVLTTVGTDGK